MVEMSGWILARFTTLCICFLLRKPRSGTSDRKLPVCGWRLLRLYGSSSFGLQVHALGKRSCGAIQEKDLTETVGCDSACTAFCQIAF